MRKPGLLTWGLYPERVSGSNDGVWTLGGAMCLISASGGHLSLRSLNEERGWMTEWGVGLG